MNSTKIKIEKDNIVISLISTVEEIIRLQRKPENLKELQTHIQLDKKDLEYINQQLLYAAQLTYRAHGANDNTVDWNELLNTVTRALSNAMGKEEFDEWKKGVNHE